MLREPVVWIAAPLVPPFSQIAAADVHREKPGVQKTPYLTDQKDAHFAHLTNNGVPPPTAVSIVAQE